jgi:hypothetical protein
MQRIVNNLKWAMERACHLFLVSRIKSLPVFKDTAVNILACSMLAGGKREREEEGGKSIHSPLHPCMRAPE